MKRENRLKTAAVRLMRQRYENVAMLTPVDALVMRFVSAISHSSHRCTFCRIKCTQTRIERTVEANSSLVTRKLVVVITYTYAGKVYLHSKTSSGTYEGIERF